MGYSEVAIAKCERRIKNITENPDPTKLASNKLFYQLELAVNKGIAAAVKDGWPPITYYPGHGLNGLLRTLGFMPISQTGNADRIGLDKEYTAKCLQVLRSFGYADKCCDRTVYPIAMAIMGDLPRPRCLVFSNSTCQQIGWGNLAIAKYFDVPVYHIHVPVGDSEEELAYGTNQVREFILRVTRDIPGLSYDEERLAEWNDAERRWRAALHEAYLARKHRPCPIGARDGFREERLPYQFPEAMREDAINYIKALNEDYRDRIAKGQCIDEKVRLVWTASGPQYDMELFRLLERRGVSLFYFVGPTRDYYVLRPGGRWEMGSETQFGRKLSPLEEIGRFLRRGAWCGQLSEWVDDIVWYARDIGADGVVNFLLRGCPITVGYHKVVTDRVESEVGIPVYNFEAPGLDWSSYDPAEAHSRMNDFLDLCEERRAQRIAEGKVTS